MRTVCSYSMLKDIGPPLTTSLLSTACGSLHPDSSEHQASLLLLLQMHVWI